MAASLMADEPDVDEYAAPRRFRAAGMPKRRRCHPTPGSSMDGWPLTWIACCRHGAGGRVRGAQGPAAPDQRHGVRVGSVDRQVRGAPGSAAGQRPRGPAEHEPSVRVMFFSCTVHLVPERARRRRVRGATWTGHTGCRRMRMCSCAIFFFVVVVAASARVRRRHCQRLPRYGSVEHEPRACARHRRGRRSGRCRGRQELLEFRHARRGGHAGG